VIEEEALATTVRSHSTSVRENPASQAYLVLRTGFVVALRDFGLLLAALALARPATAFQPDHDAGTA
jgi:hypothetical protein